MANPFLSEGFTRHTRRVFTRTSILPDTSSLTVQARRPLPPSTIIICTWMSANPHHIQNYISNYSKLFLSSHILLILAPKSPMIFSSPVSQQRQLLSGVQFLLADERKKFLVHIFSGGGAASLCNLAIAYRDYTRNFPIAAIGRAEIPLLPIQKLVLDSTPARKVDRRTADAWVHVLPHILKGWLTTWIARHFLRQLWLVCLGVAGRGDPFANAWRDLNDKEIIRRESERLYIYSEDDGLIWYRDVLDHGLIAEQNGFRVRSESFTPSGHVSHVLADKHRYWALVAQIWG